MKSPRSCSVQVLLWLAFVVAAGTLGRTAEPAPDFNHLTAWRKPTGDWKSVQDVQLSPGDPTKLASKPGTGVLINGENGRTVDLLTAAEYGDAQVHVEFCIPKQSNSGVYLMGRYEVQIYDSYGVAKDKYAGIECGGIYPRWTAERAEFEGHSPSVNASKPPGQWQTFDITFQAPRFETSGQKVAPAKFLKVIHNGKLVHENVTVHGPTRAAHWESEAATGPLLIQGDHGPVAIRNVRITPLAGSK